MTGYQRTLPRTKLLRQLRKHRARAAFRGEVERRDRLVAELRKARVTGIRVTLSRRDPRREVGELARGRVGLSGPDRGAVQRGEGGGGAALRAGLCARERLRAVRGARRRRSRRWGRGVRMSEALVLAAAETAVVTGRGSRRRPAGADRRRGAGCRRAVSGVLRGADREREDAGGVREGGGVVPGVVRGSRPWPWVPYSSAPRGRLHPDPPRVGPDRQAASGRHPRALRLIRRQPGPPGESGGRGAGTEARRHQGRDAGPDSPAEARKLLEQHRHGHVGRAPRPGAASRVMLYSFARVSAVLGMRRGDYFQQGSRGWLQASREGREET